MAPMDKVLEVTKAAAVVGSVSASSGAEGETVVAARATALFGVSVSTGGLMTR